jgi:hypothetical protein
MNIAAAIKMVGTRVDTRLDAELLVFCASSCLFCCRRTRLYSAEEAIFATARRYVRVNNDSETESRKYVDKLDLFSLTGARRHPAEVQVEFRGCKPLPW